MGTAVGSLIFGLQVAERFGNFCHQKAFQAGRREDQEERSKHKAEN